MKTYLLVLWLTVGVFFDLKAQEDIQYNHIFSAVNYYNPSFAGLYGGSAFSFDFTDSDFEHQNPGVYSSYFSCDTYLDSIRSGVGLTAYYNSVIPHNGSAAYIGAVFAPKFRLNKKYNLSPSIKPGYIHNREEIIISDDQLMPDTVSVEKNSFDLAAGLLLNSKLFYLGISVDHLFEPKINYQDNSPVSLKRKYIAQFGYHWAKNDTHASFIHLNMLYQYQDSKYSLFASNYFVGRKTRYSFMGEEFFHRILIGAGYKLTDNPLSEDGIFLGIGTQEKYLTLGVGFEISTSDYHLSAIETSIKIAFDKE
jgi:type IX secretion system PorP/SprF family membrane protein